MLKKVFIFGILAVFSLVFVNLFFSFDGNEELSKLGMYYAENGPDEVGAANLVTAIVVTYRGLDTLGEVVILFLTAAIIGFYLKLTREETDPESRSESLRKPSEILQTAAMALSPLIILFGAYIFVNGHLTPGGGFQGGAVIATGFLLMLIAAPERKFSHTLISFTESISGFSFVLLGIAGILFAGGFLDNSVMSLGIFGKVLSAGIVPIIYIFVGLKVGAELTSIISSFSEHQSEIADKDSI